MICGWEGRGFYISNYLSKNLDNYVNGVMRKKTSAVFIVDGRSGLGKTTWSSQTGCYIAKRVAEIKDKYFPLENGEKHKPKFILDDMVWTPESFIAKLKKAQKGDIIIMDESMIFSNRSAMSAYNRAVIIMMSMIRSKQIFVIFCINSIFDLDRNLALHRADMLVHLYAEDDKFAARGRYFVVPSSKGRLKSLYIVGKKYYSYHQARSVFRDKFTAFFPFNDKEYERKKQIAITNYFDEHKKNPKKTNVQLNRDRMIYNLFHKFNMKTREIAEISGLSIRSIQTVLHDEKYKKYF